MTPLPQIPNVTDTRCPRCARDWLRLWVMPDEVQVYICDECRAVWLADGEPTRRGYTYYTDFMQERDLDPASDVFTPVPVEPPVWSALTPPDDPTTPSTPSPRTRRRITRGHVLPLEHGGREIAIAIALPW